jgi:3-phenylpropionate/trans-cinnamate dioxygenase ferredoxin reductase component
MERRLCQPSGRGGVPRRPRGAEFVAFWLQDRHIVAGVNVNVWDINEHVQALIRCRGSVDVAALTDPDTPLGSLAGH